MKYGIRTVESWDPTGLVGGWYQVVRELRPGMKEVVAYVFGHERALVVAASLEDGKS